MGRRVQWVGWIGHRGDPAHAPENTLASFRCAIRKGAWGIEADVRRTADGVWVVFHDPTLKRATGRSGRLDRIRWQELARLRVGKTLRPCFRPQPIPKVEQVLALSRSEQVELFLDVKEPQGEEDLFRILRRSGWLHRTRILAGSLPSLARWRRILPEGHPLYWVTGFRQPITTQRIWQARRLRLHGFVAYKGWVTQRLRERLCKEGLELYVWTVRTSSECDRFARMGVTGLMSEVWPPTVPIGTRDRPLLRRLMYEQVTG